MSASIGAKRVAELELPNLGQKPIIDGAGHWIQHERPRGVNAALIEFLQQRADKSERQAAQ